MQHRSIFQPNTVLLASIIALLAENTVYSLHWHLSDIQNSYSRPKTDMIHGGKFSLVEGSTATCSHPLPIHNKGLGPALGSKVKFIT